MYFPRLLLAAALCTAALTSACTSGSDAPDQITAAPSGAYPGTSTHGNPRHANHGSSTAVVAGGSYEDLAMAWGRRMADCARSHGFPTFPDPVYPAGLSRENADDTFALALFDSVVDKLTLTEVLEACPDLFRQIPPPPESLRPPSAMTLGHMRQFADCLRQHGIADFPDPKADGTFPVLGTPYEGFATGTGLSAEQAGANDACLQFQQEWRLRAS